MVVAELTTSETNFKYIDGRRYNNIEGLKYPLPNDYDELDRLHLQHFVIRHIFQSNFSAPVEHVLNRDGSKVLDVGCGTGSWAFDMATNYPKAEFIGVDISPVQPYSIKPRNVSFINTDVLNGLPFEDNTFDYVFQRLMVISIPRNFWPDHISELTRVLKPGGYLELSEIGPPYELGPVSAKIRSAFEHFSEHKDIDFNVLCKLRSFVEQNGQFNDIHEVKNESFFSPETGKLGRAAIDNIKILFGNLISTLMPILDVTSEEYYEMVNSMCKELSDFNSYQHIIRIYACKMENN
ncbi:14549_t:CDS:2 [Acaulospora morrowiae]|uniref:14549_t:CDS:1 n=1 Tax=Acaulospora morrowiae TaxID=94023 RepID=A0A9N9CI06_9GLOM|nr:14549_t:CDS:2 [Acaulospora morrowiae]